jgi:nitrite reductase/ring-hydroxylating ferredoxin subunit
MPDFRRVMEERNLPPGGMKQVVAGDKRVLVVNLNGAFHAVSDTCTHTGCRLGKGRLEGNAVICPCHAAKFNVTTGAVLAAPAELPLEVFPVKVEGGAIWVAA